MPPENGAAQKQQYIRTFASDLKALQESNPDAIPAGTSIPATPGPKASESAQVPETKLPAANILAPQSAPIPAAVAIAEPAPTPAEEFAPALDPLIVAAPPPESRHEELSAPEPEPLPEPARRPEPVPVSESLPEPAPPSAPEAAPVIPEPQPSPIQTYAYYFNTKIKEKNASTASILAAEGDSAKKAPVLWKQKPDRATLWYIVGGTALFVVGCVAALYFYGEYLAKTAPVVLAPAVSAPIFVDDRLALSGSGGALLQQINQSVAKPLGQAGVRLLSTPESLSGTSTVFSALNLPAPGALARNINQTSGMAGVMNVSGNQSPFFIISVTSYADTFAGMLAWEPTMPQDVAALFPAYLIPVRIATTTATTTATAAAKVAKRKAVKVPPTPLPPPPPAPGFYDDTIANHDVREYRDSQSRIVFLYGYWDQDTLVLARDAAAFTELVNRLSNSRTR